MKGQYWGLLLDIVGVAQAQPSSRKEKRAEQETIVTCFMLGFIHGLDMQVVQEPTWQKSRCGCGAASGRGHPG